MLVTFSRCANHCYSAIPTSNFECFYLTSVLPVVKMNINIVVVGISLLPVVKMNGRCALIKTLAIPITGILSLTMYPGHSHKGSRPPTYRTRTLLTLI